MALKTIGRVYLTDLGDGFKVKGWRYFGKYCNHCSRKVFLDEYETYEFVMRATPEVDRRSWWSKLTSKLPRIKFVVEKGRGLDKRVAGDYT